MRALSVLLVIALSTPVVAQELESSDSDDLASQVLEKGSTYLDPEGILAWVDIPRVVKKGESLTLTISIKNTRVNGEFGLESVDLDWSFLDGFQVESVHPAPAETDNSFGSLELAYSRKLGPGEEVEYTINLVATKVGVYIGDVSMWDDQNFLSRYVQCEVIE